MNLTPSIFELVGKVKPDIFIVKEEVCMYSTTNSIYFKVTVNQ